MTTPVTVGTDGSAVADRAVQWAAAEAERLNRPLRIVHVAQTHTLTGHGSPDKLRVPDTVGQHILDKAHALALDIAPGLAIDAALVHATTVPGGFTGETYETVVGHRGAGGFTELLLGSTGLRLTAHSSGPVIIVRGDLGDGAPDAEVVAGVDFKADPGPVLKYAFAAAKARGAVLRVVHVWHPSTTGIGSGHQEFDQAAGASHRGHLATALSPWRQRNPGVKVIEDVLPGHPVQTLVDTSAGAALLVVGRRNRHLGSVSHGAVHHAHCPVVVLRHFPAE